MYFKFFFALTFLYVISSVSLAQTASSLFLKSDSLQVTEVYAEKSDLADIVGHCGPAVENSHMALRIVHNGLCTIDLYSKSARGMELLRYKWYPTIQEQLANGTGVDIYNVGNSLGFGGIALWDGKQIVKLSATKGQVAKVGDSTRGSFAELESCGVICGSDTLDIVVRIDVYAKKREAIVTAKEKSGKKVSFVTGLGYCPGQKVLIEDNFALVWGVSQVVDSSRVIPVGTAMKFNPKKFGKIEKTDYMIQMISIPSSSISATLVGTSGLEAELNSLKRFEAYMMK